MLRANPNHKRGGKPAAPLTEGRRPQRRCEMDSKNLSPRASVAAVLFLLAGIALLPSSSQAQAPAARSQHTAVWTGSQMIVWGGHAMGLLNTGGIYDPANNTWAPTSMVAPDARASHTAVWTGSRMIVWGRFSSEPGGVTNSCGIYDPASDTWTSTDIFAAPDVRSQHTAVWTGSRMIVWGGVGGSTGPFLNTGGLYDPASNTWTPTSI
jgi:N-acetylneuraminic acid mutarotase